MLKTFRTAWVVPALFFLVAGCSSGETDAAADNPCADNPCAAEEGAMDDAEEGATDDAEGAMEEANPCAANPCAANPCGG